MWRNHRSVYQDHMKHVHNDIVKPFKVKILRYSERIREMHGLDKCLPTPLLKGEIAIEANWNFFNQELTASDIQLAIKNVLPKSMRYELDDHPEEYPSLNYEDWCDILSTIEVKYERNREVTQIKKITYARLDSLSDSGKCVKILSKKKARTGILCSNKYQKKAHKHHSIHHYFLL